MAWGWRASPSRSSPLISLTARSLVVAPANVLSVFNRSQDEPVDVAIDGRPVHELGPGQQVEVR